MKELNLKEIRELQLGILGYIKDICDENNLDYYLISGTLLGAVKYKGYIPWDDDIDICLFRKDYLKLVDLIDKDNNDNYKMLSIYKTKDYYYTFAKVVSKKTKLIENAREIKEMGVYVDVFPIDYYDGDYNKFKKGLKFLDNMATKRYQIKNNIEKSRNLDAVVVKPKFWALRKLVYNMIDIISRPLGYKFWVKMYDRKISKNSRGENVVIGSRTLPSFEANLFVKKASYSFEGKKYTSIKDSDTYLTKVYGDYKADLPKDKQRSHHQMKVYWR